MARRRRAKKHEIKPDYKYDNQIVSKCINYVMRRGKKGIAEKIVYSSIDKMQQELSSKDGLESFLKIIDKLKPHLEVKSRRIGGSNYQIPTEVRDDRKICLALRWLIESAKKRNGYSFTQKLSAELVDIHNNRGESLKKKEEMFKRAEANRAFAHFIW